MWHITISTDLAIFDWLTRSEAQYWVANNQLCVWILTMCRSGCCTPSRAFVGYTILVHVIALRMSPIFTELCEVNVSYTPVGIPSWDHPGYMSHLSKQLTPLIACPFVQPAPWNSVCSASRCIWYTVASKWLHRYIGAQKRWSRIQLSRRTSLTFIFFAAGLPSTRSATMTLLFSLSSSKTMPKGRGRVHWTIFEGCFSIRLNIYVLASFQVDYFKKCIGWQATIGQEECNWPGFPVLHRPNIDPNSLPYFTLWHWPWCVRYGLPCELSLQCKC